MWDELVNFFDLTVTKEDIKRYNEMKKKGVVEMTAQEALARLQRIVGEYENLTDEIKKEIRKAKKELKKVCKREPKTKEEATFFFFLEMRLDERIKVLKVILKEVIIDGNGDNV